MLCTLQYFVLYDYEYVVGASIHVCIYSYNVYCTVYEYILVNKLTYSNSVPTLLQYKHNT